MNISNVQGEILNAEEALKRVINSAAAGFKESIDVVINLNIDPRKSSEHVKGTVILPRGLGREIKVAVFAKNESLQAMDDLVADVSGSEDLIEDIKKGSKKLDVDWCISTPDFMSSVSVLAKILGPKGLMPNPKYGTVTSDISKTIKVIKSGQIKFGSDKNGIIHAKIGDVRFGLQDILENYNAFIKAIKQLKPSSIKGSYFKSIFINSTMGKSFRVANVD